MPVLTGGWPGAWTGAAAGALVAGGVVTLGGSWQARRAARSAAATGRDRDRARDRDRDRKAGRDRGPARQVSLSVAAALVTLVVTRWPVAAVAAAAATGALLAGRARSRGQGAVRGDTAAAVGRLEALAVWTESLRDTIAGAVGLEQALPAAAAAAGPTLAGPLAAMTERLRLRVPVAAAVRALADDLADPSADLILAALVLNAGLRGPGLREVLSGLAVSAREEVDLRRRLAAHQRGTRRSVQIVVAVSLGVVLALVLLNRRYLAAYDSATGQLVLLVVLAVYAAGLAWLRTLARTPLPARVFAAARADAAPAPGSAP